MANSSVMVQSAGEYWQHIDNLRMGKYLTRIEIGFLKRHLEGRNRESKILVIGCATGKEIRFLVNEGFTNIWGVDLDSVAVEKLKKKYPSVKFFCVDAQDLSGDVIRNQFDIITGIQVFDYFEDYESFVKTLSIMMHRESILIFTFSNKTSIKGILYGCYLRFLKRKRIFYKNNYFDQKKLYKENGIEFVDCFGYNWNLLPRDSNSILVSLFALLEKIIFLGKLYIFSPTIIVAARKQSHS